MKKIFIIIFALILGMNSALAYELSNEELLQNISIQNLIDSIAYDMLNVAQIKQRMIFTYDKESKKKLLKCNESLTKREILIYGDAIQKISKRLRTKMNWQRLLHGKSLKQTPHTGAILKVILVQHR